MAEIATETPEPRVRATAVAKLTDQALLAKVATVSGRTADEDGTAWRAAVAKVTDPGLLASMVTEAPEPTIRVAAVAKVTDQELLARIATADWDETVRAVAVRKLANQTLLARIATTDRDGTVSGSRRCDAHGSNFAGEDSYSG